MFVQSHHSLEELQRLTKALTKNGSGCVIKPSSWPSRPNSAPVDRPGLGVLAPRRQGLGRPLQPGGPRGPPRTPPHRTTATPGPGAISSAQAAARRPTDARGWRLHLRCQDRCILEREFGVPVGRQAVYDLLHRLGYSDLMPRPHQRRPTPRSRSSSRRSSSSRSPPSPPSIPTSRYGLFPGRGAVRPEGEITRVWARRVRDRARCGRRPLALRADAVCAATGETSAVIIEAEHGGGQPVPGAVLASSTPGCMRC